MPDLDYFEIFRRIGFLVEGIALIYIGKLIRDLFYMARGYKLVEMITKKDNLAASIELCGFLFAMIMATMNSIIVRHHSWTGQAMDIALTGLSVTILLLVADWITDKAIFRKMDDYKEIYQNQNIALACGRFGGVVATGFIISGALGDGQSEATIWQSIGFCLLWFLFGQIMLILISLAYQKLTPYDDLREIKDKNVAAALPIAGILIAVGLTINSGINGVSEHLREDLVSVTLYVLSTAVLLYILRIFTDYLLLPKADLSKEISEDKNIGAGLIEGTSFIMGGLILSYFFN